MIKYLIGVCIIPAGMALIATIGYFWGITHTISKNNKNEK